MTHPRYWTEAFTDVYIEALNADAAFQRAAAKMKETIVLRCLDTPDGLDCLIAYRIDHGKVEVGEYSEEKAPAPSIRFRAFDKHTALARSTAPYDFWVKLDKGEVGVIDVIMSPDYQLEGAKLKVLRYIRAFTRMGDLASSLPKSY